VLITQISFEIQSASFVSSLEKAKPEIHPKLSAIVTCSGRPESKER